MTNHQQFMRAIISIPMSPRQAQEVRRRSSRRGFKSVSDYVRHLLSEDEVEPVTEAELARLSEEADKLYKQGKYIRAKSLAEFVK